MKCENHTSRDVKITDHEMLKSHISNSNSSKNKLNNFSYNNKSMNSKDSKATAIVEGHGNSVVEKNDKPISKGFDVNRFINSPSVSIQIKRMNEASYGNEWSDKVVKYVAESCNCYGAKQISIINSFNDDEYAGIFREATALVDNDFDYLGIDNPKAYLSSVIKKCILNHAK